MYTICHINIYIFQITVYIDGGTYLHTEERNAS